MLVDPAWASRWIYRSKCCWILFSGKFHKLIDTWFLLLFNILEDNHLTKKLCNTLKSITNSENHLDQDVITNIPKMWTNKIWKRRRKIAGQEFRLHIEIDNFEVKNVILDLGSIVNVLPKKLWESLGWPKLVYSLIQLWMFNQYCIYPIGILENV